MAVYGIEINFARFSSVSVFRMPIFATAFNWLLGTTCFFFGQRTHNMAAPTKAIQATLCSAYPLTLFVCYLVSSIIVRTRFWPTRGQHEDNYKVTARNAIFWLIILLCSLLVYPPRSIVFCPQH